MIACDNLSEHKNGKVNFSVPILKVISHSPLLFIIVPLAALILMLLENRSVCICQGSFCKSQETIHIYKHLSLIMLYEFSFQFE